MRSPQFLWGAHLASRKRCVLELARPIRPHRPEDWPGFARGFAEALQSSGLPWIADAYAEHGDGVAPAAMNNLPERRVSSAAAYLGRQARARKNLTILTRCEVEKVLLGGG